MLYILHYTMKFIENQEIASLSPKILGFLGTPLKGCPFARAKCVRAALRLDHTFGHLRYIFQGAGP